MPLFLFGLSSMGFVYKLPPFWEKDFPIYFFHIFYFPQLPTVLQCFHISKKLWIMYTMIQMTLCTPEEINDSFHYHISQITFSHKSVYIH